VATAGGVRRRARSRILSVVGVSAAVLALFLAPALGVAASADAAASPSSVAHETPGPADDTSPTPTPTPVAPTIAPVADAASAHVTATGTGTPGTSLEVFGSAPHNSTHCNTTVDAHGDWSCSISLTSGAEQTLTVRDLKNKVKDAATEPFSVLTAPYVSTSSGIAVGARVTGTAFPGAQVTLKLTNRAGGKATRLTTPVDASGSWAVLLPAASVPTGTYAVQATQSSAAVPAVPVSSASVPVWFTIDRTPPPPPVVTHPAAGTTVNHQPLVFDGTGENGATVTTYVDSNPVCTAVVHDGRWSCTSTGLLIPDGSRTVQAAQRDAAGNYGAPTSAATVTFATATQQSSPTPAPSSGSTPATPPTTPASPPSSSAAPPPSGSSNGGNGGGGHSGGSGGGNDGSGSGVHPGDPADSAAAAAAAAAASWTGPTGFGRSLPTLSQGFAGWAWVGAVLLGVVFILLVVAPLRLAASALGGRLAVRARRFTGRNRPRRSENDAPILSPVTAGILALTAGALLVALAVGVNDQLRYVRLLLAILLGLGVINGLGVALPSWLVGRRFGLRLRLRVSPRMLAVAAVACLVTRLFNLDPPMVLGVLLTAGLVDASGAPSEERSDRRHAGVLATAQLGSLAVVSFGAWVAHGLLPLDGNAFIVEVTRETLATVCLAGLGSLIVLLIPLGHLPGRALYAWSRPTLVGLGIIGVAAAAVVFAGNPQESFPVMPLTLAALAFAVLALCFWAWARFVEPELDDAA
jgi:hypothetical protein